MIYNSNEGKTIVKKNTDSLKKLAVVANKLLIDRQKSAIGYGKSAIGYGKSAIEQQKYNEPTKANIIKVYNEIEEK